MQAFQNTDAHKFTGNLQRIVFKDRKVKEIVAKLRFQAGCTKIAKSCGAPRPHATGPSYKEVGGNLMLHQQLKTNLSPYRKVWLLARRMHLAIFRRNILLNLPYLLSTCVYS